MLTLWWPCNARVNLFCWKNKLNVWYNAVAVVQMKLESRLVILWSLSFSVLLLGPLLFLISSVLVMLSQYLSVPLPFFLNWSTACGPIRSRGRGMNQVKSSQCLLLVSWCSAIHLHACSCKRRTDGPKCWLVTGLVSAVACNWIIGILGNKSVHAYN